MKFFGGVVRGQINIRLDLVAIRTTIRIQEFLKDSLFTIEIPLDIQE